MSEISKAQVEALLADIDLPNGLSLMVSGIVSAIVIDAGSVGVILDFGNDMPDWAAPLRRDVENKVKAHPAVNAANVIITAARKAPTQNAQAHNASVQITPAQSTKDGPRVVKPVPSLRPAPKAPPAPTALPGVRHVIAVASGKGGVGKSTTTINLAIALQNSGLKVGVLDADIFGPSLPMLVGLRERPKTKDKIIQPLKAFGLKLMSIGFLINANDPVVWRGPRVMGAVQQLLKDVAWGPLDVLIVDMPPGTGDVQLTMVQQAILSGAVVVSTPQDLALLDARKGLAMFQKVDVPIIGIIENMTSFLCPHCGGESHIFGHGGAEETAVELGVPFLGGIPLEMALRLSADTGTPFMADDAHKNGAVHMAYTHIAAQIKAFLG